MLGIIIFVLAIIVVVNVFLWKITNDKEKKSVPSTLNTDLLEEAKDKIEIEDPRSNKQIREYMSLGLLNSGLSKDGKTTVETSDKGRKILQS